LEIAILSFFSGSAGTSITGSGSSVPGGKGSGA